MNREDFIAFSREHFPDLKVGPNKQFLEIQVPADNLHSFAAFLKSEPATRMDYLFCETAADRKDGFQVIYHVTSTAYRHNLMIKVVLANKANPVIETVSDIWKAAEFFEREIFDLFGIVFQGHPDLRRIFLDDDWVGFPLRKDYKDTFILDH